MSERTIDPSASTDPLTGAPARRREDLRLVRGDAAYTGDHDHAHQVHLAVVRSRYANAEIRGVDASEAESMPGVVGVFTDRDLTDSGIEGLLPTDDPDDGVSPDFPILARGRVRYQGQPIAAVAAETPTLARDAAERVDVDYERLDGVATHGEALAEGAPTVHDAAPDNVAFRGEVGDAEETEAAFDGAAQVVAVDLESNRVVPCPMETRGALARYVPSAKKLSLVTTHQKPHQVQHDVADMLDMPTHRVQVRVPDVGGAFGAKNQQYAGSVLTAWAARHLERPVKWQATRTEDFQSTIHAREQTIHLEAALDDQGHIRALRGELQADVGAYLRYGGARVPMNAAGIITGPYDIPTVHVDVEGVFTTTTPLSTYRGAGRPVATYFLERLVDAIARERDEDPTAVRRRNYIAPEQFPYETPTGFTYEQGAYDEALTRALDTIDYDALRERQAELREEGRYLGIGVSSYVDRCGGRAGDYEGALVRMNPSGKVTALVGTKDNGHGHLTTFAQVVADELGVPFDDVEVDEGDTDRVPEGRGTGGSRSAAMGANVLRECAQRVVDRARDLAAGELEAAPRDVEFDDGEFHVTGAPGRSVHIQELAAVAFSGELPPGVEPGLEETAYFQPDGRTFPYGTHVAVVEVDPAAGEFAYERFVAVDDCGVRLNPKLVEGQIHGGVAQALGHAVSEHARYDDNATLVSGSFQDYAIPRAHQLPEMETDAIETPAPNNPLGVKGVGEEGTIGATPAVANAVADALAPLGGDDIDIPLTSERIWDATRGAD